MPTTEQQKILDIKVKYEDAIYGIVRYKEKIEELQAAEKQLDKDLKDGVITRNEYKLQMTATEQVVKEYKDNIRVLNKEIQNNIKESRENEGSLVQLRAQLSNLTKAYDQLSKTDREGQFGKDLQERILQVTQSLKEAEEGTERYYRNVGNYENAMKPVRQELKEIIQQMAELKVRGEDTGEEYQRLARRAGELKDAMGDATAEVQRLASDTSDLDTVLSAMTTAGGAFESVIGSLELMGVGTEDVEEAQRKLQATMAVVQGLTAIQNNLQKESALMLGVSALQTWALQKAEIAEAAAKNGGTVATVAATVAQRAFNAVAKANPYVLLATALVTVVGALALFAKGSNDAKRAQENLQREMSRTAEQLTRIKKESDFGIAIAEAAGASERAIRRMRLEAARAALALADLQLDKVIAGGGSKEQIEEARKASQDAWDDVMKVLNDNTIAEIRARNEANKKRTEAISKGGDEAARAQEQAAEKERQAIRAAEDAALKLISINVVRQRETILTEYKRTIEDIRKQLNEKGITEATKKALLDRIESEKEILKKALADLNAEVTATQLRNEQQRYALLLDAAKDDALKRRELMLAQLDVEQQAEEQRIQKEVQDEQQRNDMLLALRLAYNEKRKTIEADFEKTIQDEQRKAIENDFTKRIMEAGDNELEVTRLQMEQSLALLNKAQQMEGESIEAWNERKLQLQQDYLTKRKALAEKEVEIQKTTTLAIGKAIGGLSDIMEEFGDSNKAAARASKILALAEIAINTGVAIAEGIKQAQKAGPFPANIAAIATTVATVMSNIATAISTVKSAKFARGGAVFGAGTSTSDSIPAQLSNGESVVTSAATSMFSPILSAFNQLSGGAPIVVDNPQTQLGEDMLAAAVARGFQQAPRPIVTVEEISRVQNQVDVIEKLSTL